MQPLEEFSSSFLSVKELVASPSIWRSVVVVSFAEMIVDFHSIMAMLTFRQQMFNSLGGGLVRCLLKFKTSPLANLQILVERFLLVV